MLENLTNQSLVLIVVAIMLFIFYFILNYIYSKYLINLAQIEDMSKNMDNLSLETNKLDEISQKIETKIANLTIKSESRDKSFKTGEQPSWESLQNIFPFGSDARFVMAELMKSNPAMAKEIFPKVLQKIMEKQSKEPKDLQYMYR